MDSQNMFDLPLSQWPDLHISYALAELGRELQTTPPGSVSETLHHEAARRLADERDSRRRLYRAMEDAVCPVRVVMPGRILRSPSERRRDRRG